MSGRIEAAPPPPLATSAIRSRRQLLAGGGGLLGAAVALAGCTSKVKQPSNVPLTKKTVGAAQDIAVLNGLLRLEYRSIYAYTACIPLLPQPPAPPPTPPSNQAPKPPPPQPSSSNSGPPPPLKLLVPLAYAAAQQFLTQELAHVTELSGFVMQAGGHPVKPEASYALGQPSTKSEVLALLHQTEEMLLAGYLQAVRKLNPPELRGAAAAIMANHAQHTSILRFELGLAPIPQAFLSQPQ